MGTRRDPPSPIALLITGLLVGLIIGMLIGLLVGCAPQTDVPSEPAAVGAVGASEPTPDQSGSTASESESATGPSATRSESGTVSHVVDGDTIDVEGVGRIRVIGIDTPERGACGYESATLAMAALVADREVVLTPGATSDADRYGRLLRYVDVDGADAGLQLIEDGWAIARYDSRDGYGAHPRESQYVRADAAADDLGCYDEDE